MKSRKEDKKRFSGKTGEEYRLFTLACPHFEQLQQTIAHHLVEHYRTASQQRIQVLELGTGPGYTTEIIVAADPRIHVLGIDNEQKMIDQANRVLAKYIAERRVTLVLADALEYLRSINPQSIDAFVSGFTLHNFDRKFRSDVVREIYRVLKRGGVFINGDKYAKDDAHEHDRDLEWQLNTFRDVYSRMNRLDLLETWKKHYLEDERPNVLMHENESMEEMQSIGYENIQLVFRQHMEAVLTATK